GDGKCFYDIVDEVSLSEQEVDDEPPPAARPIPKETKATGQVSVKKKPTSSTREDKDKESEDQSLPQQQQHQTSSSTTKRTRNNLDDHLSELFQPKNKSRRQ
ncbi:unnamed protein product, partial [Didymodactylos carnosus]